MELLCTAWLCTVCLMALLALSEYVLHLYVKIAEVLNCQRVSVSELRSLIHSHSIIISPGGSMKSFITSV